ncbi:uncharacterized protein MJAP1_001739 [Malassezia japonica]|uniref:ADF-H domain-containing protein n=1 Tax=Malassezia japonica TaxID=223818 RepID=A0AAF0JA06_9BASI|nr:uncharacterized protein MJAP1_001739 [Malassezia japonica]WFD38775.1 hypothetical protein MJAP1_001739 [Malassezia japonica]
MSATTVDIDPKLLDELRKFRLSKRSSKGAALVAKIDKKKLLLEEDEILDPITPDELAEELPEHSPRFVVLSYELHHSDGRVSYLSTLYASALSNFSTHADVGKVVDIRDGALSNAILDERLGARR